MTINNRVVWEEGLFIRPQHFQQETRYIEQHVNYRLQNSAVFPYGLTDVEFDNNYLNFGKLVIVRASGVMPDGTGFNIPVDTPPPAPLSLSDSTVTGQAVYLTLPVREQGVSEVEWPEISSGSRYTVELKDIKDIHSRDGDYTSVNLGALKLGLMLEHEDRSAFSSLAITRIAHQSEGAIQLDGSFYPTSLAVSAIPPLERFLGEISGLMRERAKALAARIGSPSQAGVAEVTDFLLLQALNRMQPVFRHLSNLRLLHPERLYETFVQACGELATFQPGDRLAGEYGAYNHEHPRRSFEPLEVALRESLGALVQPRAESIPIHDQGFGSFSALLADRTLVQSADFVLAVKANMPLEQLRQIFVQQTKVTSLEKLADLVRLQLPGIPLHALPIAPRHLPYHAGFTYFEIDQGGDEWRSMMQDTSGFGFHIAGEFPGMEMELWAIRRS